MMKSDSNFDQQRSASEEATANNLSTQQRLKRILENAGATVTIIHDEVLVERGTLEPEHYLNIINTFWLKEGRG